MAKKRKSRGMKMQPAITDLEFRTKTGGDALDAYYIDTAKELSKINRRKYEQSRMYGYQGLTFIWRPSAAAPTLASIEVSVQTAGNTWITHNAHVKGEALWNEMQALVLADNPSIKGKWHQFITRLEYSMLTAAILGVVDGDGTAVVDGEWNTSTFVMPQHQVSDGTQIDPVTGLPIPQGEPLPAEELTTALIGQDAGSIRSLVNAYQESRATVSPNQPNVPATMGDSFFNLLTDSGSQEPELADVIEEENDNPPYSLDDYPGGAVNASAPVTVSYAAISNAEVDGRCGPFVAPCGLLKIRVTGYDTSGDVVAPSAMPEIQMLLHVAPGAYRGVAAIPMGQ